MVRSDSESAGANVCENENQRGRSQNDTPELLARAFAGETFILTVAGRDIAILSTAIERSAAEIQALLDESDQR